MCSDILAKSCAKLEYFHEIMKIFNVKKYKKTPGLSGEYLRPGDIIGFVL